MCRFLLSYGFSVYGRGWASLQFSGNVASGPGKVTKVSAFG